MARTRFRSAQVNVRVEPTLKDAAERAAADDHRTLSSFIEKVLSERLFGAPSNREMERATHG